MSPSNKQLKVAISAGYGWEGKTTLLYTLTQKEQKEFCPSIGVDIEQVNFNGINMTFFCEPIEGYRNLLFFDRDFLPHVDAILYLIDSSKFLGDSSEYSHKESKDRLHYEMFNTHKPILLVISKIDKRALSTFDIINYYELDRFYYRQPKFGIIEWSSHSDIDKILKNIDKIFYWLSSIVE